MAYKGCRKCRKAFAPASVTCTECGGPLDIAGESKAEFIARIEAKLDAGLHKPNMLINGRLILVDTERFWQASRVRYRGPSDLYETVN